MSALAQQELVDGFSSDIQLAATGPKTLRQECNWLIGSSILRLMYIQFLAIFTEIRNLKPVKIMRASGYPLLH